MFTDIESNPISSMLCPFCLLEAVPVVHVCVSCRVDVHRAGNSSLAEDEEYLWSLADSLEVIDREQAAEMNCNLHRGGKSNRMAALLLLSYDL